MSPIWIPWFAFWALAVTVIMLIFRGAARRDRIREEAFKLHDWPQSEVIHFIERIQSRRAMKIAQPDELDFLKALKLNLAMRAKNLED